MAPTAEEESLWPLVEAGGSMLEPAACIRPTGQVAGRLAALALLVGACCGLASFLASGRSARATLAVARLQGIGRYDGTEQACIADVLGADGDPGEWVSSGGLCPSFELAGFEDLELADFPVRQQEEDTKLMDMIEVHVRKRPEFHQAFEALKVLRGVNAKDVFAFRETWTDQDTSVLEQLEGESGVGGTERFVSQLPSVQDFMDLMDKETTAMFINSLSLKFSDVAEDVKYSDVVACYNGFVGVKRNSGAYRTKLTILEACGVVGMKTASALQFDLEPSRAWDSYCRGMHSSGARENAGGELDWANYLLRPTAVCALQAEGVRFSQSFLFYWFVGRLFKQMDMYGFSAPASEDEDNALLAFEHMVYALEAGAEIDEPRDSDGATPSNASTAIAGGGGARGVGRKGGGNGKAGTNGSVASSRPSPLVRPLQASPFWPLDIAAQPASSRPNAPASPHASEPFGATGTAVSMRPSQSGRLPHGAAGAPAPAAMSSFADPPKRRPTVPPVVVPRAPPPTPVPRPPATPQHPPPPAPPPAPPPPPPPPPAVSTTAARMPAPTYSPPALQGRCAAIRQDGYAGSLNVPGICPESSQLGGASEQSIRARDAAQDDRLMEQLRLYVETQQTEDARMHETYLSALRVLESWKDLNAGDILALRETWTDADTDILRKLDATPGAFAESPLDTEAFRERLPTVADFNWLVRDQPVAIVGSAENLEYSGFGPEIDRHPVVVRFNSHVNENLAAETTGVKTTVHVSCDVSGPLREPGVTEIDFETLKPWASYCYKMHRGGVYSFADPNVTMGFMLRPSALCALGDDSSQFTRGFLFYWFIGRIFNEVDMYGFEGDGHYDNSGTVWENYLTFEHLVYSFAVSGTGVGSDVNRRTTLEWTTSTNTTTATTSTSTSTTSTLPASADGVMSMARA